MQIGVGKKQDGKIQDSRKLGANHLELQENQSKPFSQNAAQAKRCLLIRVTLSQSPQSLLGCRTDPPTLSAGAVPRYPALKGGTRAEAGGAAQCEPLQG